MLMRFSDIRSQTFSFHGCRCRTAASAARRVAELWPTWRAHADSAGLFSSRGSFAVPRCDCAVQRTAVLGLGLGLVLEIYCLPTLRKQKDLRVCVWSAGEHSTSSCPLTEVSAACLSESRASSAGKVNGRFQCNASNSASGTSL